jgi:hypothetical protein
MGGAGGVEGEHQDPVRVRRGDPPAHPALVDAGAVAGHGPVPDSLPGGEGWEARAAPEALGSVQASGGRGVRRLGDRGVLSPPFRAVWGGLSLSLHKDLRGKRRTGLVDCRDAHNAWWWGCVAVQGAVPSGAVPSVAVAVCLRPRRLVRRPPCPPSAPRPDRWMSV